MEKFRTWLINVPPDENSALKIFLWWEIRRIPYNIIVGIYGLLSLALLFFFSSASGELKPGEDAVEPMALFIAPFMINLCYTAGWAYEIIYRIFRGNKFERISKDLFVLGVTFSFFVAAIPSIGWGIIWFMRTIHGKNAA